MEKSFQGNKVQERFQVIIVKSNLDGFSELYLAFYLCDFITLDGLYFVLRNITSVALIT